MTVEQDTLRDNVRMLGECLGQTIQNHLGEPFLKKIETIRTLAKSGRSGKSVQHLELLSELESLSEDEMLPVSRAFTQFLNLANLADAWSLPYVPSSAPDHRRLWKG